MGSDTDKKLDFRNMKQSQFDSAQTLKGSFSELQSSLRVYDTSPILLDAYTHFDQTVDGGGEPLEITYYQGTSAATYRLDMVADTAQSLAGTYFTITDPHSDIVHYFWYQVSGSGVDPAIVDAIAHMVPIATNDSALLVSATTKVIIDSTGLFTVFNYSGLAASLNIRQEHFGEVVSLDAATSGFTSIDMDLGCQDIVGQVSITYDTNGDPIYQGHTLVGYNYDIFHANFIRNPLASADITVDLGPIISKDPTIFNVPMAVLGTEYSLTLPLNTKQVQLQIRDNEGKYLISWISGGPTWTQMPGSSYEVQGLELEAGTDVIYFTGTKNNIVMEIIAWK